MILDKMNFGPNFCSFIKTLYTDISSSLIINGFISPPFYPSRGVRQGCPLSPLLYVIFMEPFADAVRASPSIIGVNLPGSNIQCKLLQYADDSTATLTDSKSIINLLNVMDRFGLASGSRLNRDKSLGFWVGKWKSRTDAPGHIPWTANSIKVNGIILSNSDMSLINWKRALSRYKDKINP